MNSQIIINKGGNIDNVKCVSFLLIGLFCLLLLNVIGIDQINKSPLAYECIESFTPTVNKFGRKNYFPTGLITKPYAY